MVVQFQRHWPPLRSLGFLLVHCVPPLPSRWRLGPYGATQARGWWGGFSAGLNLGLVSIPVRRLSCHILSPCAFFVLLTLPLQHLVGFRKLMSCFIIPHFAGRFPVLGVRLGDSQLSVACVR